MLLTNYLISQTLKESKMKLENLELNFNNLANVMFPPWYNVFKVILQMLFSYDKITYM
jgi:hypothetical protein